MNEIRYDVEFKFVETIYGRRPMGIAGFKTRAEAEVFAATEEDAEIVEVMIIQEEE